MKMKTKIVLVKYSRDIPGMYPTHFVRVLFGPGHAKSCLLPYANNKGADQPAHRRSLISAFVVRCLDIIIPLVSISKILSL